MRELLPMTVAAALSAAALLLSIRAGAELLDIAHQRQVIAYACHGGHTLRLEINGAWREFTCRPKEEGK